MRRAGAVVIILSISILFLVNASAMQVNTHNINVETTETGFSVHENIVGVLDGNETTLTFFIQDGAENLIISLNGQSVEYEKSGNIYICTVPATNESSLSASITYILSLSTKSIEKHILYNTSEFDITYDGTKLFSSNNIEKSSYVSASLIVRKIETTGLWMYVVAALLLILIVIVVAYLSKKKTSKPVSIETEEILKTKKALLMMVLKEIEKKHRSKEISDESYRYLKESYKREAVDVMKKLES